MINNMKTRGSSAHLPLISQRVSSHLSGHTLLVEGAELALIIDFDQLLAASSGERDVQLGERERERNQGGEVIVKLPLN